MFDQLSTLKKTHTHEVFLFTSIKYMGVGVSHHIHNKFYEVYSSLSNALTPVERNIGGNGTQRVTNSRMGGGG